MDTDSRTLRSLLEKPSRAQVDAGIHNDTEQEADYSAYAQGRISRHPQLTLVVRQADGSARAFSYAYFYGAETEDPALGFTLQFAQHQVRTQGRNLQILFRLICQHRVAEIRVASLGQVFGMEAEDPLVEKVEIKKT